MRIEKRRYQLHRQPQHSVEEVRTGLRKAIVRGSDTDGGVSTSGRTVAVSSAIGSNRKTLVLRWSIVVGEPPVERQASSGALTVYERITDAFMAVITWPPHTYGYITGSHNPLRSKQIVKLGFGFTDLAQYTESNTESQPLGNDNRSPTALSATESVRRWEEGFWEGVGGIIAKWRAIETSCKVRKEKGYGIRNCDTCDNDSSVSVYARYDARSRNTRGTLLLPVSSTETLIFQRFENRHTTPSLLSRRITIVVIKSCHLDNDRSFLFFVVAVKRTYGDDGQRKGTNARNVKIGLSPIFQRFAISFDQWTMMRPRTQYYVFGALFRLFSRMPPDAGTAL